MKALVFAAGRGERMRPLTDTTPKPLLRVAGKALIEYTLENLAQSGFKHIVINLAYLGEQIRAFCGDGRRWQLSIQYSDEGQCALETAGGIVKALPMLGDGPFLAINSDIFCDFPLASLRSQVTNGAHLVMIPNPLHHPQGDFVLTAEGCLAMQGACRLTFSGIGVYHPDLFRALPVAPLKLRPVLEQAMLQQRVSGELYTGHWLDIGTPERLSAIDHELQKGRGLTTN